MGVIIDVTTLHNLLKTFKALGMKALHYVMDKGFYSKKNISNLLLSRDKFILPVPLNNKWVHHAIDDIYDVIHGPEGYRKIDDEILYVHSRVYPWGKERRRCYLHLYYNPHKRAAAIDSFNEKLLKYKEELELGKTIDDHKEAYEAFFIVKTTPKRGLKVSYTHHESNYGFLCLKFCPDSSLEKTSCSFGYSRFFKLDSEPNFYP